MSQGAYFRLMSTSNLPKKQGVGHHLPHLRKSRARPRLKDFSKTAITVCKHMCFWPVVNKNKTAEFALLFYLESITYEGVKCCVWTGSNPKVAIFQLFMPAWIWLRKFQRSLFKSVVNSRFPACPRLCSARHVVWGVLGTFSDRRKPHTN